MLNVFWDLKLKQKPLFFFSWLLQARRTQFWQLEWAWRVWKSRVVLLWISLHETLLKNLTFVSCNGDQELTYALVYTGICSASWAVVCVGIKLTNVFKNPPKLAWAEFPVSVEEDGSGIALLLGIALFCIHISAPKLPSSLSWRGSSWAEETRDLNFFIL